MSENSKICCICLQECIYLLALNEDGFTESIKNIEKLQVCLPNQHWEGAFSICHDCIGKLDSAYSFIQLCLKSEEYRTSHVQQLNGLADIIESEFTCYDCNKTFRLKRMLSLHITRIHTNPKKNAKRKCPALTEQIPEDQSVENKYDIKAEETVNDIKLELEIAVKTDDNFKTESILQAKQLDSDYGDYNDFNNYSSDENIVVKKKKLYLGKKRGPKFKGSKKCQYCELEFTRSDRYVHHVRSKHTFEKPFKCELCDAKYYSQHNLNIHLRKHRNEKPFVCSVCGKCFISSNDLWQHNKIHGDVRQYACDECEKSFKTHSNLRTHKLQMHQDPGMWKYVCTVCGKKFPLNNNLIKHMRRHEGIKDFECHLCEKKFVEKIDLQSHLLSHSNERNFKCHVCFKQYKKRETLRRHLKITHDLGNFVVKKPEKKLNCPMCPKIFAFKNKLQRHILTHTGEKPYKCTVCEKSFRDNYDRNTHLRQAHNIEPRDSVKLDIE